MCGATKIYTVFVNLKYYSLSSVSKWIQRTRIPAIMKTAATKQTAPGPGKQCSLDSMTSSIPHTSKYVSSLFLMIVTLSPRRGILDGLCYMVNIVNLIPNTRLNIYLIIYVNDKK